MVFATVAGLLRSDLAIDLGTANTTVYRRGWGIVAHEPSVVALLEQQDGTQVPLSIGQAAKDMLGKTPSRINTERPVRDGKVADCALARLLLKHVLKRAAGCKAIRHLRVILGVSPASSAVEQRAIVEPTEAAGADEVYLIDEPIAAALGAGLPIQQAYGHLLVDIGGGTTNIALISLADLVYSKTLSLGGETMDAAVARLLRCKYRLEIGAQTAERLKITLGHLLPRTPVQRVTVKGTDSSTGMPRVQEVTSEDVREALLDSVETIVTAIRETFETTSDELMLDIVEGGLTLTGGGALLHGLASYMRAALALPVHLAAQPMAGVALGAGWALEDAELRQYVTRRM